MSDNSSIMLSDKQIFPTDEHIYKILGDKKSLWQSLMTTIQLNYNELIGEWNYYNDGKRWLFKSVLKKKTIFWIAVMEDTFRVTFWFGDKAEPLIQESDLPGSIKEEFNKSKKIGAVRAVSIKINSTHDLENVFKLIAIKIKMK